MCSCICAVLLLLDSYDRKLKSHSMFVVCACVCDSKVGLTYAECQVEQSHPDVQSEEQNDIGHFAEQDDVAHMLLHSY